MRVISIVVLGILGVGLLGFFGWMGYSAYQQRQGPALDSTSAPLFATRTPQTASHFSTSATPGSIKPVTATPAVKFVLSPTPQSTSSSTTAAAGDCGETGAWNILIIGSDFAEMRGPKGSDLTRVMRADFSGNKVVTYALSRDLWVNTTGIGLTNPNIDATRLGMVYYEGRLRSLQFAEMDTVIDGTRMTAKMLEKDFSLHTDHYLTINLNHLGDMVDAIGGLPINIPVTTTDPYIGMVIQAGQQTLSGVQIVAYARAIPDSDFGRIQRNNLILDALRQKISDPALITKLPDLYAQFKSVIATDLSLEQLNHLACLFKNAPSASVIQDYVRPEWTSPGPQGSLYWNSNNVLARLKELNLVP